MEKAAVDLDRLAEEWGEVGRWADTAPADAAVAAQFPRSAEIADAVTAAAAAAVAAAATDQRRVAEVVRAAETQKQATDAQVPSAFEGGRGRGRERGRGGGERESVCV